MNERIVAPSAGLKLSNLAQPLHVEVIKPPRDHSIAVELSDSNSNSPKLDLSAVVDEKLDSSGKPFPYLDDAGRSINAEQFKVVASVIEDQPVVSEAGKIPPSAANFHDVSIDLLPGGSLPLALLGQEGRSGSGNLFTDAGGGSQHNLVAVNSVPGGITIPGSGGAATLVFEGGLAARAGEPAGSHAGQPSFPITTKAGTIGFTSLDGVQTVSLGGHILSSSPQTFTDATGSLTASYTFNPATGKGAINYTYTLLDNMLGVANASFAVVVTDRDGDSNAPGANLVIKIMDDAPVARADTDAITPGQMTPESGNVLTGAGTTSGAADVQGADGGVSVVGVAAGNGAGGVAPGTVGVAIVGAFGTLTLNADGSYSYVHTVGGGSDVFTYTIRDADGSLAHATLTITLGDAAPSNFAIPVAGGTDTQVFEAGLAGRTIAGVTEPAGSHAGQSGFPTSTQTGTITFTSPDGVSKVELGGITLIASGTPQTFADATGSPAVETIQVFAPAQKDSNQSNLDESCPAMENE